MGRVLYYLIRHCQASGQEPSAPLTDLGREQAQTLAKFVVPLGVRRIVSSPYVRAVESAKPLSSALGIDIELEEELVENDLRLSGFEDWRDAVKASFDDLDLTEENQESSLEALYRGSAVIDKIVQTETYPVALFTHGKLLTLMLKSLNIRYGYLDWVNMTNPDIYEVSKSNDMWKITRIWK